MGEPQPQPPQPLAGIKNETLYVQCPLQIKNGELIVLGLLQSAINMVNMYYAAKELQGDTVAQAKLRNAKTVLDQAIRENGAG